MKIHISAILLFIMANFICSNKKGINQDGVIFYFNNSQNIYYFMPIEENSKIEDFIDGINHCKEGYQFYYSSSKFKDSIQKKVLFKQPLYNLLNEDALYKDTMYLCPVKIGFDYNVSNTYKSEKTVISQGKVNLNFNCIYINEIQIKYLR